jgi:hypothetical protein
MLYFTSSQGWHTKYEKSGGLVLVGVSLTLRPSAPCIGYLYVKQLRLTVDESAQYRPDSPSQSLFGRFSTSSWFSERCKAAQSLLHRLRSRSFSEARLLSSAKECLADHALWSMAVPLLVLVSELRRRKWLQYAIVLQLSTSGTYFRYHRFNFYPQN